jgi:hypothetical protein
MNVLINNPPKKLTDKLKAHKGNQRALARELGINPAYVNAYLKHRKEPANPIIRKKMFLPRKPKKERQERPAPPEHIKWWRGLKKELKNQIIWSEWQSYQENG